MASSSSGATRPARMTSPKYDQTVVAKVILEEAVELHPRHLTARDLSLRIVTDSVDGRALETASNAIRDLKQSGLFRERNDEGVVEPTTAALHAVALLT